MQQKLEFSTLAGLLLATALPLSLQPAQAHHEGGRHEMAQATQDRPATGQAPRDAVAGARLAATCTGCHGTDGRTVGEAIPALAGQPKEALLTSLKAFKSGERSATVMTQLAKGYSDSDLERIAAFFAAQKAIAPAGSPAAGGGPPNRAPQPARPASGS